MVFLPLGVPLCRRGEEEDRKKEGTGEWRLYTLRPSAPSHRTSRHLHQATQLSNKILFKSSCGRCLCSVAELNTCSPDIWQMFVIRCSLNAVGCFFFLSFWTVHQQGGSCQTQNRLNSGEEVIQNMVKSCIRTPSGLHYFPGFLKAEAAGSG